MLDLPILEHWDRGGFAISSIYYLVDTATDGFGYFNE